MPNNVQQPPLELPQHHNPHPPTLSGINPFVTTGLKLHIELHQLDTTRVLPSNNVVQPPDPYINDNESYYQSGSSIDTGHVFRSAENSASIKIMLSTVGYGLQGNVEVLHQVLILVIEGVTA